MSINETITNRGRSIISDIAGTANGDMKVADEMVRDICLNGDGADVACLLAALISLRSDEDVRNLVGNRINDAVLAVWNATEIYCAAHPAE